MATPPLAPIRYLWHHNGVAFPLGVRFRQILVTGPPGVGKSTLVRRIGGWSQEGLVDLGQRQWWTSQALVLRPREVHLKIPFLGLAKTQAVFDPEWVAAVPPLELDPGRIRLPPRKRFFFSTDWYGRYVFEFLLPPAGRVLEWRSQRARQGTHTVDRDLTPQMVCGQISVYWRLALLLQQSGFRIYVREGVDSDPMDLVAGAL